MANELTLTVMRNLAERHGYPRETPLAPEVESSEPECSEEPGIKGETAEMLQKLMRQTVDHRRKTSRSAKGPSQAVSLDELAARKSGRWGRWHWDS